MLVFVFPFLSFFPTVYTYLTPNFISCSFLLFATPSFSLRTYFLHNDCQNIADLLKLSTKRSESVFIVLHIQVIMGFDFLGHCSITEIICNFVIEFPKLDYVKYHISQNETN